VNRRRNLEELKAAFDIVPTPTPPYAHSTDWTQVEVRALHVPVAVMVPPPWVCMVEAEWACSLWRLREADPRNPLRVSVPSMPLRGQIQTQHCPGHGWVAFLCTQFDAGPPSPQERLVHRLCWFEQCLGELAEFMHAHELTRVGFPHGIGCNEPSEDWRRFGEALAVWAERHPEFSVHLVSEAVDP
jgi:hypothetical protein